jgi:hypothetical protein
LERTAWLLSLCWRLPEGDVTRARLAPVLMRRLAVGGPGRAANDTWEGVERDMVATCRPRPEPEELPPASARPSSA